MTNVLDGKILCQCSREKYINKKSPAVWPRNHSPETSATGKCLSTSYYTPSISRGQRYLLLSSFIYAGRFNFINTVKGL